MKQIVNQLMKQIINQLIKQSILIQQVRMMQINLIKYQLLLTITNFNHKNKLGKLKFNDINDLTNSIKGNTVREADTKKKMN